MTRFGTRPGFRDQAAATVVGAILVVGILVLGLITLRTSFVPAWEEEAEQRFMDGVTQALLGIRADLGDHAGALDRGRLTTVVPTSQGQATPLAPPREGNLLSFQDASQTATVHADDATVWRRNGTLQIRENLDWRDVPGTDITVREIDEVLDLRARFATVSSSQDGGSFVVRVLGATGGIHGEIEYSVEDTRAGTAGTGGGPERSELVATVENSDGDVVFDQTIATFTQPQSDYEVDVLDPGIGFDQILASAPAPKRLLFTETAGLDGERVLTFRARNGTSDATVVHPAGGPVETVHEIFSGGSLEYESRNNFFVDQTYRLEHGALVLEQEDGAAVRAGPHAPGGRVEGVLGQARVAVGLDLPTLDGSQRTVSGAGAVSVASETASRDRVRAVAPEASINVTTETPEAWASWARDRYRESGLAPGEFTVTSGTDFVNVTVRGPSTDPAVDDVHLALDRARITTTLER